MDSDRCVTRVIGPGEKQRNMRFLRLNELDDEMVASHNSNGFQYIYINFGTCFEN